MRRLTTNLARRGRRDDDRGAVAIIVAFMVPVIFGFAAVAMDLSYTWLGYQQVRNGADAAAISIAQQCAKGSCPSPSAASVPLIDGNRRIDDAQLVNATISGNTVTVTVESTINHFFAGIIGHPSTTVSAKGVASWDGVYRMEAALPFGVDRCVIDERPLSESGSKVRIATQTNPHAVPCDGTPASFAYSDGAFTPLNTNAPYNRCALTVQAGDSKRTSIKAGAPLGCSNNDLNRMLRSGDPVVLPVYDSKTGTGFNTHYNIVGFAAFEVVEYCLAPAVASVGTPCSGTVQWIDVIPMHHVAAVGHGGPGGADFGLSTVGLVE